MSVSRKLTRLLIVNPLTNSSRRAGGIPTTTTITRWHRAEGSVLGPVLCRMMTASNSTTPPKKEGEEGKKDGGKDVDGNGELKHPGGPAEEPSVQQEQQQQQQQQQQQKSELQQPILNSAGTNLHLHVDPTLQRLRDMLDSNDTTPKEIFSVYRELPPPRLYLLGPTGAHRLLKRLMNVERKTVSSMLRYMSVIDDMKHCNFHITQREWNTALSFVSRCHSTVLNSEMESALYLWREMEKIGGGIESDGVTFNILFDMATKSKSAQLPEMILKEMQSRQHKPDRFTHVGKIWYAGRLGQGSAVKDAYKDFVASGEIVDTVALNCLMSSLIRVGEPQAAEQILEHMKNRKPSPTTSSSSSSSPSSSSTSSNTNEPAAPMQQKRTRAQMLKWLAIQKVENPAAATSNEDYVKPDLTSFSMFISYHCEHTGNFERVCGILDDMAKFGIRRDRAIYQALFKGFALHGKVRYSPWTRERLEGTFKAFVEEKTGIGKDQVLWCCRAFLEIAGPRMATAVWRYIRPVWEKQQAEEVEVQSADTQIMHHINKRLNTERPDTEKKERNQSNNDS